MHVMPHLGEKYHKTISSHLLVIIIEIKLEKNMRTAAVLVFYIMEENSFS
jgi:hypothetical protein